MLQNNAAGSNYQQFASLPITKELVEHPTNSKQLQFLIEKIDFVDLNWLQQEMVWRILEPVEESFGEDEGWFPKLIWRHTVQEGHTQPTCTSQ